MTDLIECVRMKGKMDYCKDAQRLLGKDIVCGKDCPISKNCPRLILEDASDNAIDKAIEAMIKGYLDGKRG